MKKLIFGVISAFILGGCCSKSCCDDYPKSTTKFDDKYVQGFLISKKIDGSNGIVEIHKNNIHANSYLAFVDMTKFGNDLSFEATRYLKISSINGLPYVTDVKSQVGSNEIYKHHPVTEFNYHILSDHGIDQNIHKKFHIIRGSYNQVSKTIELDFNGLKTYTVPDEFDSMALAISTTYSAPDSVFMKADENNKIIYLDTIHRHGSRVFSN